MASAAILQNFIDLSEPREKTRLGAACGLKRAFQATAEGKPKDGSEEGLSYTLKRLSRGVTSSRLCSHQGFSLALSEILESHPDRLQGVLQLVKSNCELQRGLRPSEQKDRLVGRLVSYAAILSAGSLQLLSSEGKGVKSKAGAPLLNELGRGLKEVFEHRNFLKESAAAMLLHICQELCTLSRQAWVPELLGEWNLDRMLGKEDEAVQVKGIVLELRLLYEAATLATNASSKALAAWPSCVRSGSQFMEVDGLVAFATALAKHYRQLGLGDATPRTLHTLCKALLTPEGAKALPKVLDALDQHFFHPPFPKEQARALRGMGDLISGLCAARLDSKVETSDSVLTEFFTRMKMGLKLMMRAVTYKGWYQNEAAVYAQQRMLIAIGGDPMAVPIFYNKHVATEMGEAMQKMTAMKAAAPPPWPLKDETRMALYGALQKFTSQANLTLPGKYQKLWDRGLLATMSKEGVRAFCSTLLSQQQQKEEDASEKASEKVQWFQKGMLVLHREAPDEVLMALLCHFITVAYFAPAKEEGEAVSKPKTLREFCSFAKMKLKEEGEDMPIPFLEGEVQDATFVRGRFWSLVSTLFKRTLPETSVRVIAAGLANSAGETDTESVVSTAPSTFSGGQPVKTFAFQGLLNDGSMLITRLHQFWDFLLEGCAEKTPKKKRKSAGGDAKAAGGMRCLIPLSDADKELRRQCMEMSQLLSPDAHEEGELLKERQKNGINGFLMAMLMALVTSEDEEEKKKLRPSIKEVLEQAEKVVPAKGKELTEAKLHEALSPIPRLAAELYTETTGLVKEGAYSAWRELGDFITNETIKSLCAAVQDKDPEGEEEPNMEENDEEEEEEPKEEEEDEEEPEEEEEADKLADARGALAKQMSLDGPAEIELDADALWSELIDDGQGDAGAGSALASAFGGADLEAEAARQPMKAWQRDISEKHEDAAQKFQELDLLEVFLRRAGERRMFAFQIMLELYGALLVASDKATRMKKNVSKRTNKGNRKYKAELATEGIQASLSEKIAKVMQKTLRKVRKQIQVTQASTWYTPEEWEQKARELNAKGAGAASASKEAAEVGGTLLHFMCLVHRACKNDCSKIGNDEGWELAREFLRGTLDSWDGKKVNEHWCSAVFKTFAGRTPVILYSMPWMKHLRAQSSHFVLRSRIKWVNQNLVRVGASTCGAIEKKEAAFLIDFAEFCADLFEKTLEEKDVTASAKKQWRQALLESLKHVTRANRLRGPLPELASGGKTAERIAAAVIKVRDTLQSRVGAVYQGCVHVLRVGLKREDAKPAFKLEKPGKRPRPAEAEEQPAAASGAKRKVQKQQGQGLSEGIPDLS